MKVTTKADRAITREMGVPRRVLVGAFVDTFVGGTCDAQFAMQIPAKADRALKPLSSEGVSIKGIGDSRTGRARNEPVA